MRVFRAFFLIPDPICIEEVRGRGLRHQGHIQPEFK
jgi:hypothetical protein